MPTRTPPESTGRWRMRPSCMMSSASPRLSLALSVVTSRSMRSRTNMRDSHSKHRARTTPRGLPVFSETPSDPCEFRFRYPSRCGPHRRSRPPFVGARQVVHTAAQRHQLRVVGLGNVDVERVMDGDDEIQEVERVEEKRVAQIGVRRHLVDRSLRDDLVKQVEDHITYLLAIHSASGRCSTRSMVARKRAPRWLPTV